MAPRFQRRPANALAKVSTDVEFACDVYGNPAPSIQWMKNGEVIINSNYFQISDGGRSLKILGLVPSDRAVYQCLAENVVGNVQASAQLAIAESGTVCAAVISGDRLYQTVFTVYTRVYVVRCQN